MCSAKKKIKFYVELYISTNAKVNEKKGIVSNKYIENIER